MSRASSRIRIGFALAVAALSAPCWTHAQPSTGYPRAQEAINVKPAGLMLPLAGVDARSPEAWSLTIQHLESRFVRLRFTAIAFSGAEDFEVVVIGPGLSIVERYSKQRFLQRPAFWTPDIRGGFARVLVLPKDGTYPRGLSFRIGEYVYQAPVATVESYKSPANPALDDVSRFAADAVLQRAARSVAKLRRAGRESNESCTGFMVSPDKLLTNEHCVPNADVCDSVLISFDWNPGDPDVIEPLRCTRLVDFDPGLDFALIEVTGRPGAPAGRGVLPLIERDPGSPEFLRVIQYPGTDNVLRVTIDACGASVVPAPSPVTKADTDFGHDCDTTGGSSGSPVLDKDYQVVGLHHWGYVDRDKNWESRNRAVRMKTLYRRLAPELK